MVADLIQVRDLNTCTALEVTAGGKLFNVVVEDEVTGKQLLEKGKLKRRVTIIPLNKISTRTLEKHVVQAAEKEVRFVHVHFYKINISTKFLILTKKNKHTSFNPLVISCFHSILFRLAKTTHISHCHWLAMT